MPALGQEDPLEWQSTPVLVPGESHGQWCRGVVMGYSPWGHEKSDTTEHKHTYMMAWSLSNSFIFSVT